MPLIFSISKINNIFATAILYIIIPSITLNKAYYTYFIVFNNEVYYQYFALFLINYDLSKKFRKKD